MYRNRRLILRCAWLLTGLILLTTKSGATAQFSTGGTGMSSFGSGSGLSGSTSSSSFGSATPKYGTTLSYTATGTSSTTNSLAPSNAYGPFYGNPLSFGVSTSSAAGGSGSRASAFGQPTYGNTGTTGTSRGTVGTTGTTTLGSGLGSGTGATGTFGRSGSTGTMGASSIGFRRSLPYSTQLAMGPGFVGPPSGGPFLARSDLQEVLTRSESLPSRNDIKVGMVGTAVVLVGKVASEHEARLAEALVRLTPGVYDVHNELIITASPPPKEVMPSAGE